MKRHKTVPSDLDWDLVLRNLEVLAGSWDEQARDADRLEDVATARADTETAYWQAGRAQALNAATEDLRTVLTAYLYPGLRVRYFYREWRVGNLLVPPTAHNPCWQIKRDEVGAMIDQVKPGPNTIRVYTESGTQS